jgi:phosphocarrier protein HPr
MYEKKIIICNPSGLHARPASEFIDVAVKFKSEIMICRADEPQEKVSAKSMVMLLTLGLAMGDEAILSASGPDEKQAIDTLSTLIESGFGE